MGLGPNRLPFANMPQDGEPTQSIPPLPDIQAWVTKIRREVDKAKTTDGRVGFIDVGIDELKQIKGDGWRQYNELVAQHNLDDPDPFLSYDADLDKAINELGILRQRLILAESDRSAPVRREEAPQSKPMFATARESSPSATAGQAVLPEVMDIKQLASYLGVSYSWLYKNYESEGIPHFSLGTNLRFRRDEVDQWIGSEGKGRSVPPTSAEHEEGRKPPQAHLRNEHSGDKSEVPNHEGEDDIVDLAKLPEPNPRTISIVDKLIPMLCDRLRIPAKEAPKLREWLLYNARGRVASDRVNWNCDRRSLATLIVLCQHADIIHLSSTPRKNGGAGPGYSVALREGFLLDSEPITKELAESIARSHLNLIEGQLNAFEAKVHQMMAELDPGLPSRHRLFSALLNYYEFILTSLEYTEYAKSIDEVIKAVDKSILRTFYDLVVEIPDLASFQDQAP